MYRILLVDDDQGVLECFAAILRRQKHTIIAMQDGLSALNLIREGAVIDLIITDYRMPGMDGLEFVHLLRTFLPDIPVIMLTGYGSLETYCQAGSLGVSQYVMKPIQVKVLEQVVSDALADRNHLSATAGSKGVPLMERTA